MAPIQCFMVERAEDGWIRSDNPQDIRHHASEFGPGAMWFQKVDPDYLAQNAYYHQTADNRVLNVQTPGGSWCIDSYCSNCTRRGEPHSCWCRHGEAPNITVDKIPNPGETTCSAGAGSIQCGDYHGFLRNGFLVP
jgi:hypothetical protein